MGCSGAVRVLLLCGFWMALTSCSSPDAAPPQAGNHPPANEYLDSAACAACHAEIARTYSQTGMARSFYPVGAASVPNSKPYFHPASGTWYRVFAKDGGWVQRWWQTDDKGREESAGESRIDYVMGSGNHVRAYLHRTARGTLIQLPLAWYAEKGGTWALNPGLDVSDPPAGRKIGYDCMFCHNAYPSIPSGNGGAGAEPVYTRLPQGIDCQRCHGPGGNHVQAASRPGAQAAEIRAAIVNPARLANDRAMDVCAQCHLETTSFPLPNAIRRYEREPFSYRPGEPWSAFQLTFDHAPGSGRDGKFEIVNSVYRLRQSKCFLESQGDLRCTTCHNPHDIQHGQSAAQNYNRKCEGCHPSGSIAAKAHPAGGDCTGCHMPKRRSEDVVHAVMTDHLIQRRAPANPLAEFAEKRGPEVEYRGEVVPYGDKDDLYTAIAQVAHRSNLESGIARLKAEIAKRPPERAEGYMELGDALQKAGRTEEAAEAYRAALRKRPNSAMLWARLAAPLRASGKSREALDAMRKAAEADPNQPETWYNTALLQSSLGDKKSAIESFRKSIALDPESAESRNGLAIALAETGQLPAAEAEFRNALSLRPSLAGAHAYLAYLMANRGEVDQAIGHFERGGGDAFNQFNYGITLARMNRLAAARTHLEQSLQADARQPQAHQVLGRLLEAEGKTSDAIAHYREATRLQPAFGQARVDLGTALARMGDKIGAAREFQAAQFDPDPQVREIARASLTALGVR